MIVRRVVPSFHDVRIALVSTPFVPVPPAAYGGTELIVHELQRGLLAAGHQVTLFATGDSEGPDVRWLFERAAWPPSERAGQLHARAAAAELAAGGWDLVHAHVPAFLPFAAVPPAPVVYTLHHARDEALAALYRECRRVEYVAISARQARLHPELRCHVVHHGVSLDAYPAGDGRGGHALFIGRLSWCKGPDVAVEAARLAEVELVVAGEAHEEPENPPGWTATIEAALARPGVRRVGAIGGERKRRLLGGARALLMPIRWEEPFGLVMIEAMLAGTPVVAFRRGAAPEVVDEGITGFLVGESPAEMADALRRVRTLDREACRRQAQRRFSSRRMVADYLRVYHAAIAAARGPRPVAPEEWSYAG
jgi:glycosyltransferase involved in cell wall biosynthesis